MSKIGSSIKITYQYADWGCNNPMDYMTDVIVTDDKGNIRSISNIIEGDEPVDTSDFNSGQYTRDRHLTQHHQHLQHLLRIHRARSVFMLVNS